MRRIRNMVRGFTLIELLIVLAVIAALLSTVTPIALNAVAQAKATQVASTMRNIRSAVESYVNIETPPTLSDLDLDTLVNKGYLSGNLENFELEIEDWDTTGLATVTITYTGSVDEQRLERIYSEISNKSLIFHIRKWW